MAGIYQKRVVIMGVVIMGVVIRGKKKMVSMGMAGTRIEGKGTIKITDGSRMFCTPLPPGQRIGRIINRMQSSRLSRTA